jgi:hypothetical protein
MSNYQKLLRSLLLGADGSTTETGLGSTTGTDVGSTTGTDVGSIIGTDIGSVIGETGVLGNAHVSNPSDKPYPYAAPYTNHICVMAAANVAKITIPLERATESESFNEIVSGIKNDRTNTKTIETINPYAIDHKNVYPTALALPIIIFLK